MNGWETLFYLDRDCSYYKRNLQLYLAFIFKYRYGKYKCGISSLTLCDTMNFADVIVRALTEHMVNAKENFDENLIASFRSGDLVKFCECELLLLFLQFNDEL